MVAFIFQFGANVALCAVSQNEALVIVPRVRCSCWLWRFRVLLVPGNRKCFGTDGIFNAPYLGFTRERSAEVTPPLHPVLCDGKARYMAPSPSLITCN